MGGEWSWLDTAELPFSLDVLSTVSPCVSLNHLYEEGVVGRPGRRIQEPFSENGGPRYGFERCFHKASPSPMGPISSRGPERGVSNQDVHSCVMGWGEGAAHLLCMRRGESCTWFQF